MKTITINGYTINEDSDIHYEDNPKRPGFKAHGRYSEYMTTTTLAEYLEATEKKYAAADLRYDEEHGYLTIYDACGICINEK